MNSKYWFRTSDEFDRRAERAVHLARLKDWLEKNPKAWSGWPTGHCYEDVGERQKRVKRLLRYGCPVPVLIHNGLVDDADNIIADLRLKKRHGYAVEVEKLDLVQVW